MNGCCLKVLWLRRPCADVTGMPVQGPTKLHCDNRAAEMWTRNPQHFVKQQHIDRSDLSVREQVLEFKTVTVHLIPTQDQLADCFTKSLPLPAFRRNIESLMDEAAHASSAGSGALSQAASGMLVQQVQHAWRHGGMLNSAAVQQIHT